MAKTKTAKTTARVVVASAPRNGVPTSFDECRAIARTVTPANFNDTLERATANHGVPVMRRNVGRFTNDRIMAFQNRLMAGNAAPSWQFDDVQLAWLMAVEFPAAVGRVFIDTLSNRVAIVRGIRADYNRGTHGNDKPATPVDVYGAKRFDFAPVTSAAPAIAAPAKPASRKRATA